MEECTRLHARGDSLNITIKDVAKAAGVSVATVSRVLNKSNNVSDTAIEAVNKAVRDLGYSPNFLGRDLRKCETKRILAIITSTEQSFYSEVLRGMQETSMALGYDVLIGTTDDDVNHELRLLNMLFSRTVDAAILLGSKMDAESLNALGKNHNIALCVERVEGVDLLTVTIDNTKAGYDATKCLLDKGQRRIAMISTNIRAQSSVDREIGYKQALAEYGVPFREEYLFQGTYSSTHAELAVKQFFALPEPPTAIFAISDRLAIGALNMANNLGINVGKDLYIIGFDDIAFSRMFIPSLSTVAQPLYQQGAVAVKMLIDDIKHARHSNQLVMLEHSLVLRKSTND